MSSRASEVLFLKTQQYEFLNSDAGKKYMIGFETSMQTLYESADLPSDMEGFVWYVTKETVRQADPVYISDDVTSIIEEAYPSFEPEVVLPTDPFTPCGWAVFPRPVWLTDRRGIKQSVRAIGWLPALDVDQTLPPEAVWVTFFSHADDPDYNRPEEDYEPFPWREISPHATFQLSHIFYIPFNKKTWDNVAKTKDETKAENGSIESARQQWSLLQTMWRIGQQLVPTKERALRPARRDAQRKGIAQEDITVVKLRRERHDVPSAGDGGYLTKRHLVRGHWRNQFYPSIQGHRQKWIAPYVKGPDDGELVLTDRVYEFVR